MWTDALRENRNTELSMRMVSLIRRFAPEASTGLDVGAFYGEIAARLAGETGVEFAGIEPRLEHSSEEHEGVKITKAGAENIPFGNATFDIVTLISVYEHFPPPTRRRCLSEIYRVLKPGGVLIGQMPNMYYPIEPHSMLPLQSYLPAKVGEMYFWRFKKREWKGGAVDWYRVGPRQLKKDASAAGFRDLLVQRSNYSIEVIPHGLRRLYPLMQAFPPSFDFVFRKGEGPATSG
jgi:SAM-dependent methyltransferase